MNFLETERLKPPVTRRGIYWLASYPKSGNTWTRAFIGHLLGTIGNDPEVENTRAMLNKYTVDASQRIYYKSLLSAEELASNGLGVFAARPHAQQLLAANFAHSGFAKTHSVALSVRGVSQINLGVTRGAVYIVRNPLDVVCSYGPYYGRTLDQAIADLRNEALIQPPDEISTAEVLSSWSAHVASWVDSPIRPLVLRYEDMLDRPEEAFAAFTRHANLAATPEQIRRAIDLSAFSRMQSMEAAEGFDERVSALGRKFFRAGKSGEWRDALTPEQVKRVVADHGKMMERFGYLPE